MSNTPTSLPTDLVPIWYSPTEANAKKPNKDAKRQPLQQKSGNKRPRPLDLENHHGSKPTKSAKKTTELETLSDLVEKTETAIYNRNQVRKMPRKKLENAYFSLQNTSTQVFLPAQKQRLADQRHVANEGASEQVPDVVMGICNNYIEITAELMKMMEKTEEEKQHLQNLLNLERQEKEMIGTTLLKRAREAEEENRCLKERLNAVSEANCIGLGTLKKASGWIKESDKIPERSSNDASTTAKLPKYSPQLSDKLSFTGSGQLPQPLGKQVERLQSRSDVNAHIEELERCPRVSERQSGQGRVGWADRQKRDEYQRRGPGS